jgi:S1-C subfamily serine protease
MGVNIIDVNSEIAEKLKLDKVSGVLIMGVTANGAAAGAGLQEQDVIIAINDAAVNTTAELQEQVGRYRPSDRATVRYIRNGREQTASLTLQGIAGNNLAAADRGTDVVFGAKLSAISATEKRRINILNGVRIMEVNDGKFKDIGMREGYIILSINDRRVDAPSDVYVFTDNGSTLKSISGVQTNGTTFNYQFGN